MIMNLKLITQRLKSSDLDKLKSVIKVSLVICQGQLCFKRTVTFFGIHVSNTSCWNKCIFHYRCLLRWFLQQKWEILCTYSTRVISLYMKHVTFYFRVRRSCCSCMRRSYWRRTSLCSSRSSSQEGPSVICLPTRSRRQLSTPSEQRWHRLDSPTPGTLRGTSSSGSEIFYGRRWIEIKIILEISLQVYNNSREKLSQDFMAAKIL